MRDDDPISIDSVRDAGRLIRAFRKAERMNQTEFGLYVAAGRRFVSEFENGKESISFGMAIRLLDAAGFDLVARRR